MHAILIIIIFLSGAVEHSGYLVPVEECEAIRRIVLATPNPEPEATVRAVCVYEGDPI